ncbi:hypothetical protein FQA39_LY15253 [Lamprigera yunnana]|nr:hypothetical protein FQA39_LY15253 [Lamprigera yunnana]
MGRVYHHEIGKRHTNNMQNATRRGHDAEVTLQVAPGEPIPPGVETEVEKVAQIQERLDNFTVGPLIGLEYLFELVEYDRDKEPSYLCLLCDKKGDPRTVIAHLASYNHIIQYTQRHFISCFRALAPYITKQYKRNWQATMQKIAEAIETKFGRLKPHVVEFDTFEVKRVQYQNLVASGRHFSEKSGITFEELVDKEQLTKISTDDLLMTKLSEEVAKRPYRKSGTEPTVEIPKKIKRSPSPPVVQRPKKLKAAPTNQKRRSLSSVSSISSSDLSDFDPSVHPTTKKKIETEKPQGRNKYTPYKPAPRKYEERAHVGVQSSNSRRNHGGDFPWENSDYIRSRSEIVIDKTKTKSDKVEEFKKLVNALEKDMERIVKQHEKNPEKHPQYNEEWKKFWNKRYKELQAEGKDVARYDFKPEWIEFWNKRMTELHNVELKQKKDALRKRLGLPEEPAPICFKITGKKRPRKEAAPKIEVPSTVDNDSDVIVIDDKDEDTISSKRSHSPWETEVVSRDSHRSREKSKEKCREFSKLSVKERSRSSRDKSKDYRSRSNSIERDRYWKGKNRDKDYYRDYKKHDGYYRESYKKSDLPEYIKPPRVMRDVTRYPVLSPTLDSRSDDSDVNIVGILRLLTALEEKLGSLGPKIIDLLAQALALEKTEGNSSEVLLDNEVNCVLFETVKEKLKGQVLAGLVDYNQQNAFKNAIKKIASLIHYASERKKKIDKEGPKADPISVPGIGTIDKAAIAKQVATALIHQGKTDISQGELEQLINAVVGMAEASRNSDKPITTASFVQQLTQKHASITSNTVARSVPVETGTSTNMEGLSDLDLQTLLQNFKDLCTDEQHSLISYLKKMEAKEPERVERLRKFVNLDSEKQQEKSESNPKVGSPFANRLTGMNPLVEENIEEVDKVEALKVNLDSDEEEYTFEDVFKAAKQNVKENEERERNNAKTSLFKNEDFDLSNAKSLIANIMGQFKSNNESATKNLLGLGSSTENDHINYSSDFDVSQKPSTNRIDFASDIILRQETETEPQLDFSQNYPQNVFYPHHQQYVNTPQRSFDNQNQLNQNQLNQNQLNQNQLNQNRIGQYNENRETNPYLSHGSKYDNYHRW